MGCACLFVGWSRVHELRICGPERQVPLGQAWDWSGCREAWPQEAGGRPWA